LREEGEMRGLFKRRDKIKSGNEYEISVALTGIAI
jgi:hypothetical protein